MRPRRIRIAFGTLLLPAALVLAALLATPARADLVSPGELSRAHEKLEGLQNCTRCHSAGQKLSPEKCLECHKELRPSVSAGKGFHGRLGEKDCTTCHHEHQGRGFALVDWGDGGQKSFDHQKTGWALSGKHAKLKCADCHDPRRVTDGAVKEVIGKGRKSMLGAPATCVGCHFDEHRGQVGTDCARCHDAAAWKPATKGFDHAKTKYPLTGLHVKVPCAKCHVPIADPEGKHDFPQAVSPTYAKLKPLPFAACTDCHKDPHQNRFGPLCATCHVVEGWRVVKPQGGEAASFHDKTRYPLRGAHVQVACKACHGPFEGQVRAKYKDMAFAACTDCHRDAHVGQLGKKGTPQAACDRCHAVQGWVPVRFDLAEHQKTKYPLEGAHLAVACDRCHVKDPKLAERVPAAVRAEARRERRPAQGERVHHGEEGGRQEVHGLPPGRPPGAVRQAHGPGRVHRLPRPGHLHEDQVRPRGRHQVPAGRQARQDGVRLLPRDRHREGRQALREVRRRADRLREVPRRSPRRPVRREEGHRVRPAATAWRSGRSSSSSTGSPSRPTR